MHLSPVCPCSLPLHPLSSSPADHPDIPKAPWPGVCLESCLSYHCPRISLGTLAWAVLSERAWWQQPSHPFPWCLLHPWLCIFFRMPSPFLLLICWAPLVSASLSSLFTTRAQGHAYLIPISCNLPALCLMMLPPNPIHHQSLHLPKGSRCL